MSGNYSFEGFGDNASDIFDIRTTAGTVAIVDFEIVIDKIDFTDFNLGNSSYWTATAAQSSPSVTTLTLTGQAQEQVTVILQGVSDGSTLFQFWNSTTGDNFELLMGGVGFGLITQPDIII